MKSIYCISGLGADQRMFQKLELPGVQLVPVKWPPFSPHDTIPSYAQKVSALIPDENPTIIGLSFGGMVAVEIAKIRPLHQLFLVSSAKAVTELPYPQGWMVMLIRFNLIPTKLINRPNEFVYKMFGAHTDDERALMKKIMEDTDGKFLKWALRAMLKWGNDTWPKDLIHIHGTADKMIPAANVHPTYWIEGGQHIMIYNRAAEVSALIHKNLIR